MGQNFAAPISRWHLVHKAMFFPPFFTSQPSGEDYCGRVIYLFAAAQTNYYITSFQIQP
jgi:hypothetical protein